VGGEKGEELGERRVVPPQDAAVDCSQPSTLGATMAREMTYEQVRQAKRHAYWEDQDNHYMLWYDPAPPEGINMWITARDTPYPHAGAYGGWVPWEGDDPPVSGWYHPQQPCTCEFCS